MIRLSAHSLTPAGLFFPESMALNIMERGSTAQITQGLDEPSLQVGDWLLDQAGPGAGIVWRVKTADNVFSGRTVTYTLEHIINTLRDISMFGETKPADITGTEGATTCTAQQAAQYVLSKQSIWTLGDFEYTDSAPFSFNGDDLFSALEKITSTLDDPWWDYDLSSLPFKLHIRHKSTDTACEMRMGRNIATLRKTVDRSQMYTRIYPIGKKNLHITGEYLSRNENIWGRKDRVETDQSKETEEMLRLWALDRLKRHCEPAVTITIGGLELSAATGEPLDHLVIGTVCRVPLPEFGVTITERITKLSWKDKIKEPENVTVTLCNTRQDIASIISEQISGGGGGARADAKEKEEDHAWFVDTTSHVAMVAEAIIGREGGDVDWSRVSEIIVDGSGIHQLVVAAQGSLVTAYGRLDLNDESLTTIFQKTGVDSLADGDTLYSQITQTAESITAEITRATNAEGSLSTRITQTAESITAEVTRATTAEGSLSSRITQTAESITAEITRATNAEGSLSSRITQTAESITAEITRATNAEGSLSSRITQTAESITAEISRATNAEGSLSSRITQTSESLTSEVTRATAAEGSLSSRITQEADKIALVVGTSGNTSYIKTASIVAGINAQSGSYVAISADKIDLTGYVKATDITANLIASKLADVAHVVVNDLEVTGWMTVGSSYGITGSGNAVLSGIQLAGSSTFTNVIKSASVSGGTLTLTPASGNAITFTKAVTLTGAWGGTASAGKAYSVTATMNGTSVGTKASPSIINIVTSGNPTYNASTKKLSQTCIVLDSNDEDIVQRSVVVKATDAYDAGYTDGEDSVDFDSLGSWNQGYALITLTNGKTTYGQMPSPNSATWTSYRQGTNLLVYCTIGGREYQHTFSV